MVARALARTAAVADPFRFAAFSTAMAERLLTKCLFAVAQRLAETDSLAKTKNYPSLG
jgi:hypothetical protein